ncbi:zinc finger MYM-type protein 3 [Halyomorpha halys]|uniref:zinc finger MYM-type protein 3 n=1 Tax=Halyomorpha halys TaxID=286706 RepID=UPI0006D4EF15|nr:zinc finger MYM-type protein 2 [Halyomorpha halys]XP_014276450.1 zinc finger MYM-type protein 2 [Halyomorpha halys]XP_014276451.1 zinc finger MYM-type protein 2 [Halyomorpha halys]
MNMDDNICNSSLNLEAGNNLISETSLSSHEDSISVGNDKTEENPSIDKNVTDYVNGLNEDESQSCDNSNNDNNPEFTKQFSSSNENEISNESEMEVNQNESSSSGHKDPLGNENSSSDNAEGGNEKANSKQNSDLESEKKKNVISNECSVSGLDQCGDDSTLSEANPIDQCEDDSALSETNPIACESESNKNGNSESDVVILEDSEMEVDEVTNNSCDSNDKSSFSNKEKGTSLNKHGSIQGNVDQDSNDSVTVTNSCSTSEKEVSSKPNEQINGNLDDNIDEEQESVPKIQLVTSLDVFIDEEANTASPAGNTNSPVNPLETDHEDTNDNDDSPKTGQDTGGKNIDCINVSDEKDDTNDSIGTSLESESRKNSSPRVYSKDKTKNAKDPSEQEEVITGDKTVSHEYVTKNLELMGDGSSFALNDHGYSKPGTPTSEGKEVTKAKKSSKTLKVIYPKKKVVDVNQLDIEIMPAAVLKNCLHCAKLAKCFIRIEVGGSECHLCSEDCLEHHKTLQSNTLRRTSIQPDSTEEDIISETRICVQCNGDVSVLPEEKILSWETMEFCNEDCLGKYQSKMWTCCTGCSKEVPTSSMGKYCVRFGHEIKQFCCSSCLEDFKKGIKACSYCQKDLSVGDEGFLAPIADKNQFRDFCSQNCLDEYDCMSRNLPAGGLKVEACGVCDKTQLVQVQVITATSTVNLCSEVCFKAFKFVNKSISPSPCYMCKKYFETNSTNKVTVYYENEILSFCSKTCMNINILAKRRIVACNWCKVKKYNFDMIRRKSSNKIVTNWCSLNCMALYQVSLSAISLRNKTNCAQCYKYGFPLLHLTMSDATIRNFCSHDCVNKFKVSYKDQSGNGVFPTGGPKRVVRAKSILPASSEKNTTYSDNTGKDVSGFQMKAVNPAVTVSSPVSSAVVQNKRDEAQCASPLNTTTTTQTPLPNVLTLSAINPDVKNAKIQVSCRTANKAVLTKPYRSTRSSQTDEVEEKGPVLIPVPVPIFIPVPLAMYSLPVPTPFPFPVPIPVPIIIPTTRGTAEEIMADIKKIQDKMPGNPYEAELLMMAEMAEGQKKSMESEESNSADPKNDEALRLGQKRSSDEVESDDGHAPPEKKRKGDYRNNILDSAVHHLATSQLSISLKETLGVSAWKHYASQSGERLDLVEMRPGELAQALKRFIQNARIPGEGEYTPDQKYYLMLGIQYYLEKSGRIDNIFSDNLFDPFIDVLNEEAKKFQQTFANSDNVITRVEEEHLWESKQLGPHSPATLLATLIYFNTKYFNLTTVEEHMQLSFSHIMKHWKRNPNTTPQPSNNVKPSNSSRNVLLKFYPPQSSLDAPNSKKKKVYEQEANEADPYRCPVQLYEFYLSKCPESMKSRNDVFYLNPERSCVPDSPIWYSTSPVHPEVVERALNRFKMVKEINLALLSDV